MQGLHRRRNGEQEEQEGAISGMDYEKGDGASEYSKAVIVLQGERAACAKTQRHYLNW